MEVVEEAVGMEVLQRWNKWMVVSLGLWIGVELEALQGLGGLWMVVGLEG